MERTITKGDTLVTEHDNDLMGLTYEAALLLVCDGDLDRYAKARMFIDPLLEKIPEGWHE